MFGTNDKLALRVGMVSVIAVLSLVVGALARRRPIVGPAAMVLFGLVGGDRRRRHGPNQSISAAVPAVLGAVVGGAVIWYLVRLVRADDPAQRGAEHADPGPQRFRPAPIRHHLRRGRRHGDRRRGRGPQARERPHRPHPHCRTRHPARPWPTTRRRPRADVTSTAPEIPADATLSPVTPYLTPNDDFYLIDTALSVPRIRLDTWSMEIGGRVDTPITLTYDDLLALPQVERIITIACVSNEVGGDLIGNAVWQGVLLRDLLERGRRAARGRAGVRHVASTGGRAASRSRPPSTAATR